MDIRSEGISLPVPIEAAPPAEAVPVAAEPIDGAEEPAADTALACSFSKKDLLSAVAVRISLISIFTFFSLTALIFDLTAAVGGIISDSGKAALSLIVFGSECTDEYAPHPGVSPDVLPELYDPSLPPPHQILPDGDGFVSSLPEGNYPIKPVDISSKAERGLEASNETGYSIDLDSYLQLDYPIPALDELHAVYGADAPTVLIIHTHGTEAYAENNGEYYSTKDNCRTTDTSKNVVAVGRVMADYFNENGIVAIHSEEMFDAESYVNAYDYANAAIKEYVAIYPSIKYVFDVHRDSLVTDDMTKLRPLTLIDGKPTAQYMCVIGTDENAGRHVNWERNLTFACYLQSRLWEISPSLPRRMSIRSASYNQRHAEGSLLLEIGSCGNTLSEAKACALIVAEQITALIKGE